MNKLATLRAMTAAPMRWAVGIVALIILFVWFITSTPWGIAVNKFMEHEDIRVAERAANWQHADDVCMNLANRASARSYQIVDYTFDFGRTQDRDFNCRLFFDGGIETVPIHE